MTVRVVIADDQSIVRAGLSTILNGQPDIEVIGQAADGREAVALARELRPDVCLLDIRMPNLDGIEATRLLAGPEIDDPIAVVVITTFDTDEYIHGALKAGARGFLLKGAAPDQLIQAIHAAVHGDALIDPGVTARLLASFSANALAAVPIQPEEALTEREEEVLLTVARGKTNAEIGEELHISISTVKFHVASLMTKLAARNRVELAMWAYENEPREVDRYHPVIADPAAVPQARGATLDPWPCRDPGTPALAPDTSPIEADFGPSPVRLNAEPRFVGEEPTVIDGRTWDTEVVWGGAWAGPDQDRERPDPRIRAPLRRHRPSRRRPGRHPPNRRP